MNWDNFFKAMIAEEHAAYAKYGDAAEKAADPALRKVLEQFRYEESIHADILEQEYAKWRKRQA